MYGTPESRFVEHGSCDSCGSRDNVAWYSNGTGYCFGCGKFHKDTSRVWGRSPQQDKHGTSSATPQESERWGGVVVEQEQGAARRAGAAIRPPPDDLGTYYPSAIIEWMKQYGFTVTDLVKHNVKWSPKREQLVYLFYGEGTDVVCWQARNFRPGTTHKDRFFTGGQTEAVIAVYYPEQGAGKTAVIVEGCADGIQLAKAGFTGVPVFGSKMQPSKMTRICKIFEEVIWWLDSDKFNEAVKQSNLCKLLGTKSRVVNTAYDPKCYNQLEIVDLLSDMKYR